MHFARTRHQDGNALVCALLAIIVLSTIGANVLMNCTTRYNASSNGVRAWKQALYAAETTSAHHNQPGVMPPGTIDKLRCRVTIHRLDGHRSSQGVEFAM